MDQPINAFDLSPEQQETASLLQRLLGSAIANRYVDLCRLSAGAFALNVSRPMAAHALRELDSMLRGTLEVAAHGLLGFFLLVMRPTRSLPGECERTCRREMPAGVR